ncbi:MAG TPA: subclass B1 metallo-beta-lactamase [Prolixibacteraceae bacterium]|nr:subclass B1 metallo-beta-lactamase [Prolixibacteraceae bacterium]HPR59908.1 subclass B1 metallo-beta-lactamase [Prolixibacteraceae bacterium]
MKNITIIFWGLILLTKVVSAQFETKLSEQLFISELSETVFVVTHYFPWESNSLIVKASDDDVVLIDTPYENAATGLMLQWIDKKLKPQKITAINTGFHIDNLGGNALLREKGIDIYGSNLTCKLIDEKGAQTQQQIISWLSPEQEKIKEVYEKIVFTKPNKTFQIEEGINLKIGNLSIEVFYPGESHSPDNVVVYINEIQMLFGGCMVKSLESKNLGFTGDANLDAWPVSMKIVQEKYANAKVVIPHHGMWGDMSLVQHTIELLSKK